MFTNTVTFPNGTTITKPSKRNYTHAVVIGFSNGNFVVGAYATSEQGARRSISSAKRSYGMFADDAQILIVEVK